MNFIMKGIHTAVEPLRYTPTVATRHSVDTVHPSGVTGLVRSLKHRRRVRRAIRELNSLSNETLADIGIERGNIPEIVAELLGPPAAPANTGTSGRHDGHYSLTGSAAA